MEYRAISFDKKLYARAVEDPLAKPEQSCDIKLFLPPSDIPNLLQTAYKPEDDVFLIQFQYNDFEKPKKQFSYPDFDLFVGESSGKVLTIEIKSIKKQHIQQVKLTQLIRHNVSQTIEQESQSFDDVRRKTNLERASALVESKADELAATAV